MNVLSALYSIWNDLNQIVSLECSVLLFPPLCILYAFFIVQLIYWITRNKKENICALLCMRQYAHTCISAFHYSFLHLILTVIIDTSCCSNFCFANLFLCALIASHFLSVYFHRISSLPHITKRICCLIQGQFACSHLNKIYFIFEMK